MKAIDLNTLRDRAYKSACEHGFHDQELSNEHFLMLVITELSEAVEADRKEHYAVLDAFEKYVDVIPFDENFERHIKNSIPDELSDVIIRLLDLAGLRNIAIEPDGYIEMSDDITFTEFTFRLARMISELRPLKQIIQDVIYTVFKYCERNDIDLLWHIEQKMKYNELRPKMHSKAY